jgi:non-ribosomal peptide synthetase component F
MALSTQQEDDYIARHQFQLPEDVDFFKLQFAWNTVSQKLPILRTRIVQTSMGLFQVIVKSSIGNFADNSTNFPMRLGTALNRVILDQQQKVLTWISHHATYDGISIRLIMKLVNQVYREIPLDPMDFTDYRIFINYIRQLSFDASKSFWASQLADVSPEWFPSGGSSITHVDINGRLQTVNTLAAPLTSEIIRASWGLVLAAYTSSDEVVFGTILSGRTASVQNIDRIAGPTIATVPIRVRIDDGEKIEAFLTRLQEQAMEMIPHQHFGLQNIRRISDDVRHACDFHNLLVIHAMEEAFEEASSVLQAHGSLTPFNMNTYPLVLEVHILPNGYSLDVSYDRSITSEVQIQRLVRQFDNVVSHLLCCRSQPSSVVSDIQVISSADREELWLWNNAIPETVEDSLHHLIEQRVQLAPDAEAIVSWDGRMTYFELDQASSILAHEIFSRDKSVGSFVPLFFEKSLWTVVAMLAVLKAGKAFAFLDPSYPVERLRQVTSILTPHLAISSHIHQESCRKLVPDTIVLGPDTVRTSKKMVNPPTVVVRSSDPICAIFTSGTTGKPKGAILSHRSYVSSNMQHAKTLSMDSTTRMLQFGSCSFDAIIFEVLTTLLVGGCVCVPEEKYRNIDIDVEITRMKANWALFTPSFASLLSPEQVPTLKALILVGEAANVQLIQTWSNKLSLHNGNCFLLYVN